MGSKHKTTLLDRARDELFSHVIRCEVLEAHMDDRKDWLADTMDFMAHRYPQLSEIQLAQLEVMGQRFIKPAIPHGSGSNAVNRTDWQKAIPVVEPAPEADTPAGAETPTGADAPAEANAPAEADAPVGTEAETDSESEPELATAGAS
jgi:hypothetical protein